MKEWHRKTKLQWARPVTLFSKGAFIPWVVHRAKWKMQSHAESAQHSISFNLYQNQVFSCILFHKQGSYFLYIIFWPGGLLTFYDHFLIKVGQLEHLLFLKCFFLDSLACITLKVQSYIFMEQRFHRLQQRKNLLTQSLMLLMLRLLLVFSTP